MIHMCMLLVIVLTVLLVQVQCLQTHKQHIVAASTTAANYLQQAIGTTSIQTSHCISRCRRVDASGRGRFPARFALSSRPSDQDSSPQSHKQQVLQQTKRLLLSTFLPIASSAAVLLHKNQIKSVNAVGNLFELQSQGMVLQDLSFNVIDLDKDIDMIAAMFQSSFKVLRRTTLPTGETEAVLGFGPDVYKTPAGFFPGVTSFLEYGGHATLTLRSKKIDDDTFELFEQGNGLKFVKIGTEVLKLSKAIQRGGKVNYAYGWVELDTPNGLPLQGVIGIAKDPLMSIGLRVTDINKSKAFFQEVLGMKESPPPLARTPDSEFEPKPPKDSVFLSYGPDNFGILLIPIGKKDPKLSLGTQLQEITIVADDQQVTALPAAVQQALSAFKQSGDVSQLRLTSPDGYVFRIKPYSTFEKEATEVIPAQKEDFLSTPALNDESEKPQPVQFNISK